MTTCLSRRLRQDGSALSEEAASRIEHLETRINTMKRWHAQIQETVLQSIRDNTKPDITNVISIFPNLSRYG